MQEVKNSLEEQIKFTVDKFLKESENREIQIISHFDTDGITSAVIMIQTLKKLDRFFSLKIVKSLNEEFILNLPKDKITFFLDLASSSLNHITKAKLNNVFIIDHHEISREIPKEIAIINPELYKEKQKISSAGLTYLFCKEINSENKEFAKLAVLGMIGDQLENEIDILNNGILDESEIKRKRGLLIYPSTIPLNRTLEYSSKPYIPGVTGNIKGVLELLRESGLKPENGKYKSLIELNEEEMKKLTTTVMLRIPKNEKLIGDIFLIKFYNKLEDAREISSKINACSRLGESETAIQLCMELSEAKKRAESIHAKYKQLLLSALKFVQESEQIKGEGFTIINARNQIQDTIIGTIASILSHSVLYKKGTIVTTMAYYENKIKVSARNVGKYGRNVREILSNVIEKTGGEVGGHKFAAGCIIKQEKENEFIDFLKKQFEIELIKV